METPAEVGDVSGEIAALRAEGWSRDGIHEHLVAELGLSHFQAEEAVDGNGTYTETARTAGEEADDLRGIGGWLVLPAFWIVLQPLFSVTALRDTWALRHVWSDLAPNLQRVVVVEAIGMGVLLVLTIVTAVFFFRSKRETPVLVIGWLLATSVFRLYQELGVADVLGRAPSGGKMIGSVVAAVVWTAYFLTSRRVKNTFVR